MELPGLTPESPSIATLIDVSELRLADGDIPERTTERVRLSMQLSPPIAVEYGIHGRQIDRTVEPGNFCLAPAGEPVFAARWRGERHIFVAELAPSLLRAVAEDCGVRDAALLPRLAFSDPRVTHLLLALREEFSSGGVTGEAYVEGIARGLVARLLRAHSPEPAGRRFRGGLAQPLLRRIKDYIEARLDQDLDIGTLASISGLSADHFARAFRESTGVPPHRYVLRRKVARARKLLQTTRIPILEIAHLLRFSDQSHLTNVFRRQTGLTPGQVRGTNVGHGVCRVSASHPDNHQESDLLMSYPRE